MMFVKITSLLLMQRQLTAAIQEQINGEEQNKISAYFDATEQTVLATDLKVTRLDKSLDGYNFYQGKDSGGNDIENVQGKSIEELARLCDELVDCKGFNNNGWLKHTLSDEARWSTWTSDPNKGFYVKEPGYDFYQGKDSGGNDIKNVPGKTREELRRICDDLVDCKGFNTNGWLKYYVKDKASWGTWTNDPIKGFYVKEVYQSFLEDQHNIPLPFDTKSRTSYLRAV